MAWENFAALHHAAVLALAETLHLVGMDAVAKAEVATFVVLFQREEQREMSDRVAARLVLMGPTTAMTECLASSGFVDEVKRDRLQAALSCHRSPWADRVANF